MGQKVSKAVSKTFDRRPTIRASRGPILRQQQVSETPGEKRRRNEQYRERLARAEREMDRRMEANACPREELKNFKVLGMVSKGGIGSVFLARHLKSGIEYALKVQAKAKFDKPYLVRMAVREKKLLYALDSDFLVKAVFAFQDWKNLYLVMEYAAYGDLFRLIGTRNPKKTVKYAAAQMILGIEYLHACRIAHRDLKPGNIFICRDFYLKIGDFGFSKKIDDRTYTVVGTVPYRAPEMFRSDGYGKGVDWWALGIILYRLLYTKNPFAAVPADDRRTTDAIQNDTLRFPIGVDPNTPPNKLIKGLLEKDLSGRLGCTSRGVDEIKDQQWFCDVSFLDIFEKKITFDATIAPVRAKDCHDCAFMPTSTPEDGKPGRVFDGF